MEKTYFISVEGIDGSGKDTQLFELVKAIREDDNKPFGNKYSNVWITRNPTNITPSGVKISNLIRKRQVSGEEAAELYVRDRIEHTDIIKSMLKHSHVIISRYDVSTLTYQAAQGQTLDELYDMHKFGEEKGCIDPDITLIFDVSADVSMKRATSRGEIVECFENLEFLRKARDWHLKVAEYLKNKGRKVLIINADQPIEEVTKEMLRKIDIAVQEIRAESRLNIFFTGAVRGGRENAQDCRIISEKLSKYGNVVTTQIASDMDELGEDLPDGEIYKREVSRIEKSDVFVADVTVPSLGVGFFINHALSNNKIVLCLHKEGSSKKLSAMVGGSPDVIVLEYKIKEDIEQIIDNFFKSLNLI